MYKLQRIIAPIERPEHIRFPCTHHIYPSGFLLTFHHTRHVSEAKHQFGLETQDIRIEAEVVVGAEQTTVDVYLPLECAAEVVQDVFFLRELE